MIKNNVVFVMSGVITVLAAIASLGGLLIESLYHDNAFVKMAWFTNDLVTLFLVVPSLVVSIYLSRKGNVRWSLILSGLLGYIFYNFAFYLFGSSFNTFFLLYTSLLFLSACSLILFLSQSWPIHIAERFSKKTAVKWISLYLMLITSMLFMLEVSMIIPFLAFGTIPETIRLTANPTSIVFALDFSIVIPVSIIAAILLWHRSSWGFVLSIIMLVKGFTYGLVLCIGTIALARSTAFGKWDSLMPLYIILVTGGFSCLWALLKNLNPISKA
jgi:hypothetical protein